jgi:hypothetical protein
MITTKGGPKGGGREISSRTDADRLPIGDHAATVVQRPIQSTATA